MPPSPFVSLFPWGNANYRYSRHRALRNAPLPTVRLPRFKVGRNLAYPSPPPRSCSRTIWVRSNALHIATERLDDASTPDVAIVAKTFVDNVRIVARVVTEGIRRAFKTKGISRVIVTGDHGTTRFATLAWQTCQGAIRTIDAETMAAAGLEPVNWRTARCTSKVRRDPAWVLSGDQTCASIRGYDRFSVRGGLGFESHGGATLEERAVPLLVVLNKMPASCEATRSPARPARQIVEDSDFDI